MHKLTFSVLVSLFLFVQVFASDTITRAFKSKNETEKVSYFRNLNYEAKREHLAFFKSSFENLIEENTKAKERNKGFLFCLALIEQLKKNNIGAILNFKALLEDEKYNLTKRERIDIYVAMQESYLKLNLYSKVFDCNNQINSLIKHGEDYPLWSYNIQSRLYLQLQQYYKAIPQLKKEISFLLQNKKRDSLIIPSAYNDLGYYYSLVDKNDSAIYFFNRSLQLTKKNKKHIDPVSYTNLLINTQENIANAYLHQKEFDKAINKIIAIDNLNPIDFKNSTYLSRQIMLANAYLGKNDYKKTTELISKIDSYCCMNNISLKLLFLNLKHAFYKKTGNSDLAYDNLYLIKKTNDSISNVQQQKLLKSTELNYVIEQSEREVLEKNKIIKEKENTLFTTIIGALSILLILSFLFVRINRKKRFKIEKMNLSIAQKNTQIEASLKEKEILLKEIHHRVKNNLQIISGILDIQNFNIKDPEIKTIINEGQNRIQSIALLHKTMYQNKNFNAVNFDKYLAELISHSKQANYSLKKQIEIDFTTDDIQLEIDTAVPLGLILNELINNAYKHAFREKQSGNITISLKEIENKSYQLIFNDNGNGFASEFDVTKVNSVGYELINGLTKQLKGKLTTHNEKGAVIVINFNTN
ncbi:hypothetical protein GFJ94_01225 [Flavobacterium sp. LMO8]|uniref:tetratricopeptide repeat-containing sensor histidine kinase n=1 Tax=Flavobacterium sp. LMO8 TaxID=2654244 RepID=UPI001290DE58|nr:histidine kinase dimerization/phosphoacceptor domain -containing protein [Flavobacterium sp. LMO8]MQP23680.1 hypothetical protein [Flavobacterium sp. LMO8]